MKKAQPKFWKGLIVMCGDDPVLIEQVIYDPKENDYSYIDHTGTCWSEDSFRRQTLNQSGFGTYSTPGGKIYYRKG